MEFNNLEQLVEFFNKLDLEKSTLVFKEDGVEESHDCGCGGTAEKCACDTVTETTEKASISLNSDSVLVESFADSPSFNLELVEEGENLFYVNGFRAIPDACGTGMIELPDRISSMNMCEMDGKATVKLDVVIEGKELSLPFQLVTTDSEPRIVINKSQLL